MSICQKAYRLIHNFFRDNGWVYRLKIQFLGQTLIIQVLDVGRTQVLDVIYLSIATVANKLMLFPFLELKQFVE